MSARCPPTGWLSAGGQQADKADNQAYPSMSAGTLLFSYGYLLADKADNQIRPFLWLYAN